MGKPQIMNFHRVFPLISPSILGFYPYFWVDTQINKCRQNLQKNSPPYIDDDSEAGCIDVHRTQHFLQNIVRAEAGEQMSQG